MCSMQLMEQFGVQNRPEKMDPGFISEKKKKNGFEKKQNP